MSAFHEATIDALRAVAALAHEAGRAAQDEADRLRAENSRLTSERDEARQALTGRTVSCGACSDMAAQLADVERERDEARDLLGAALCAATNPIYEGETPIWTHTDHALVIGILALREERDAMLPALDDLRQRLAREREEANRLFDLQRERLLEVLADKDAAILSLSEVERERDEARATKDGAYSERNRLVAALSKLFPASIGPHVGEPWEDDWRNVVFIDLPTGQVSWHIHDSELPLFAHLGHDATRAWDGHSDSEKWQRVARLAAAEEQARAARVAAADEAWREAVIVAEAEAQRISSEAARIAGARITDALAKAAQEAALDRAQGSDRGE